ncbi:sensor histidine kinase [Paracoccus yeei]|uniref:sensor histidine kinase n=1 Tax=Paracoccus yeei TaxID=147645 RepID=UPI0016843ED4|nr:HAMP domain-containing sensor histidine kinase [Paracoccus yeei]
MTCRPSLRFRLWLGALLLAGLAVTAAGLAAWGLIRTQAHAIEAMAAQNRIEAYGALSARLNEWLLAWVGAPGMVTGMPGPDSRPVVQALDRLDRLLAEDVKAAPDPTEATVRARQSMTPARLRGLFNQLESTFRTTPPDTPAGQAALAFHAAQAPGAIARQIDHEMHRREAALAAMQSLRRPLLTGAALVALAAPLVLAALYLLVLGPLFRRLRQGTAFAATLSAADLPHGAGGHDELGLMFARLRQMAARIDRRRARLEAAIEERTAALSAANDRLALIDRNRRRFFADVGHELRTPLTVIMGEAELGEAHPDPEARAAFQTIGARAARLFRRIEDMLRIARSESGRLELAAERVDLGAAVRGALADLAPALKRAGVSAQVDLPPLAVRGDPDWLRQVFAGLFENAAKYAGRGAEVTVSGRADGGMALVRVADTGRGLPEGLGAAVLDRFTRDAQADQGGGFGVGLALARWVVETLGGSLVLAPSATGLALDLRLPLWEEE